MNESQELKISDRKSGKIREFISALPRFVKIFYILGIFSVLLFAAYIISEPFADFFNRYISSVMRALLAYLTRPIPFSLAEMLIILLPVIAVALIIYSSNRFPSSWRDVLIFCASILSVLCLFFSVFTVAFAPGYHGRTLDKKLGIERREVSAEELYDTAMILTEKTAAEADALYFGGNDFSVMPYTFGEMNDKLIAAYEVVCEKYSFI